MFFVIILMLLIVVFVKSEMEYDYKNKDTVPQLLPWVYPYGNGIIVNKNGSLMKIFKFSNYDLSSATADMIVGYELELNDILKRLDEGYVLNVEAKRKKVVSYPDSKFEEEILQKMDNVRKEKTIKGGFFETDYYISISWFPKKDVEEKTKNIFLAETTIRDLEEEIKRFETEIRNTELLLKQTLKEIKQLDNEEALAYLKSCVSFKEQKVLEMPGMYMDSYLNDTTITPGVVTKVNDEYLGVISILSYPTHAFIGVLDQLNELNIEYRWNSRFIYIGNEEFLKSAKTYQKKFYGKRKGLFDLMFEKALKEEVLMDNQVALDAAGEAAAMSNDVASEATKAGYYTFSFIIKNKDEKALNNDIEKIMAIIQKKGFVCVHDRVNSLEAFLGSLPGDIEHNVRKPMMLSINYIDLIPLSQNWEGEKTNNHFNKEALLFCESGGSTSFKLNLHVGDVGHSMILGPTGAGKSVLISTIAYSFRKYKDSQVLIFDKGGSSRILTAGVGGKFYDFGINKIGYQPLRNIDNQQELEWAMDWICNILEGENLKVLPVHKNALVEGLKNLANSPVELRTITGLVNLIQNKEVSSILEKYTKGSNGMYGLYFDNDYDDFNSSNSWQVFEMEEIFNSKRILVPLLEYLFHKLEVEMFKGKPTLLLLDECWLMLDNPYFAAKIREWVKVLRKKNVSVVFATQSLGDVAKSSIKDALFESCLTKIYLPNLEALNNEVYKKLYKDFGLNDRELEIIRDSKMKRDYYYKSQTGVKLFQLNLNELELAYVASSSQEEQNKCKEILKSDPANFNQKWLEFKGLHMHTEGMHGESENI